MVPMAGEAAGSGRALSTEDARPAVDFVVTPYREPRLRAALHRLLGPS
jgi:hypothetical protein